MHADKGLRRNKDAISQPQRWVFANKFSREFNAYLGS